MEDEENIGSSKEEMPLPTWLQNCVDDVIRKARSIETDLKNTVSQYASANNNTLLSENELTGDLAVEIFGELNRILNSAAADLSHQGEVIVREFKSRFPSHLQNINYKIDSSNHDSKPLSIAPIQVKGRTASLLSTFAAPSFRADPRKVSPARNRNDSLKFTLTQGKKMGWEQSQQAVSSDSICQSTIVMEKTDYKLHPSCSFVPVEKLGDAAVAVVAAEARHIENCLEESNMDTDSEDDELAKALKRNDKSVYEVTTDEDLQDPRVSKRQSKFRKISVELTGKGIHRREIKNEKRSRILKVSDSDSDDFRDFQPTKRLRAFQSKRIKRKKELHSDIEKMEVKKKKPAVIPLNAPIKNSNDILESPGQKGRRKIREIMDNGTLLMSTRVANIKEEERKTRVAERQSSFNAKSQLPVAMDDTMDSPATELILDTDIETKRALVSVDPSIAEKLQPHQVQGIIFMWEACFESVEQYKQPGNNGSGCILAHCMGLGKTLQTVAFVHTVLTAKPLNVRTALIVTPLNTVYNWETEFETWLKKAKKTINVHSLFKVNGKSKKFIAQELRRWKREGGVAIIHYDFFRSLVNGTEHLSAIEECLLDPGPDFVVCDEGHLLKNHQSQKFIAINRVRTKRRVILTGTPLQNNLMEYHTMVQFVKPDLLGTRKEFANRFNNPIKNGQHKDSSRQDVTVMKRRAHVLYKMLEGCIQRRDFSILTPYLPPKHEYAIILNLSSMQKKLYNHYLDLLGGKNLAFAQDRIKKGFFLGDFAALSRIWSHPLNLLTKKTRKAKQAGKKKMLKDQDNDEDENVDKTVNDEPGEVKKGMKVNVKTSSQSEMEQFEEKIGDWWLSIFKDEQDMKKIEYGSKCLVLMEIVKTCLIMGDKVLVFSQYLYSLDMIEEFLKQLDEEANENMKKGNRADDCSRWRKRKEYFRLDGSVAPPYRKKDIKDFNGAAEAKLYLLSTTAGGLGINLVGANRVVLFDASFNPSNDMQSIFRVYRFGQKKPCYIYRLLAHGTMEEKVYNRQVVKLSLSGRVVDEHQIDRHFSNDEVVKMYSKVEDDPEPITPEVPQDKLLADLLVDDDFKNMIHQVVMHDSLLRNQENEKLTDEERRVAWEEYEAEKKRMGPVPILPTGLPAIGNILNAVKKNDDDSDMMEVDHEGIGLNKQSLRDGNAPGRIISPVRKPPLSPLQPRTVLSPNRININSLGRKPTTNQ